MTTSSGIVASEGAVPPVDGPGPGPQDPPESPPGPRGYEPMSVRTPALIVLGLAVFILIGGVVASALSSGSDPSFTLGKVTLPDGTTVVLAPASVKLHPIVSKDEPPADILGNLGVPKESVVTGILNSDQDAAQFDRTVDLTSRLSQDQVVSVFSRMLKDVGWQVIYTGSAPQGTPATTEVLAKHGSGDGFYWETGVVVSPTTPTGTTPYTVEVLQTPDGN
jgi:hypothetical protein